LECGLASAISRFSSNCTAARCGLLPVQQIRRSSGHALAPDQSKPDAASEQVQENVAMASEDWTERFGIPLVGAQALQVVAGYGRYVIQEECGNVHGLAAPKIACRVAESIVDDYGSGPACVLPKPPRAWPSRRTAPERTRRALSFTPRSLAGLADFCHRREHPTRVVNR